MSGSLIDRLQQILEAQHDLYESLPVPPSEVKAPAQAVRINPAVLAEVSRIPGWFQHSLFHVQDSGRTAWGPNATMHSPVVNRVFIRGRALQLIEDSYSFLVTLDHGVGGW